MPEASQDDSLKDSHRARIDQPTRVRAGEKLDSAKLTAFLAEAAPGMFPAEVEPLEIAQFPSGFSNLTYLVRVGRREYVLRRPPFGSKVETAHDMGREFRVLSALSPIYPKAPRPLVHCQDPAILGAPFYVMERVRGVILRPQLTVAEAPAADEMARVARALVETLAELHAVDVHAVGLQDFGKPSGYVARQVAGWAKRYQRSATDEILAMERVATWLVANQPAEADATLIHNDYKYDNLVLDASDLGRVLAVLDWEMATLGDPLMDLGTSLGYWVDPDDPPVLRKLRLSPTDLPGNPTRAEVAEAYARASGRDLGDLVFYYAFGLFKIAVIAQQIYYRYQQGLTQDERFAMLIHGVRACAQSAQQAIERQRIDRLYAT